MRLLSRYFDELRHLRVVIEAGSINRAAKDIAMSQSALTRSVARLENALGVSVLIRTARGVLPTAYGEALIAHIRTIDAELSAAHNTIQALKSASSTLIRCGATRTPLASVISAAAEELQRMHPNLQIRIKGGLPREMLTELRLGELDIVVAVKESDSTESGLSEEYIDTEMFGIYVRSGHPLLNRRSLRLRDLSESEKWVTPITGEALHQVLTRAFMQAGVPFPTRTLETSAVQAMRWLALNTDRLVISTPGLLEEEFARGGVQELEGDWQLPPLPIVMYLARQNPQTKAIRSFIDCLRKASKLHRQLLTTRAPPHPSAEQQTTEVGFELSSSE